jgi:hypothetical protein
MTVPDTIMVHRFPAGMHSTTRYAPMTAAQTFNRGALVQVVAAGTVTALPYDNSEALIADLTEGLDVGVAINGPGAAANVEIPGNFVKIHPDTGNAYATGDRIWYVPADQDVQFRTNVTLAAGGAAAGVVPNGADRGAIFQVTGSSGTTPDLGWGIENASAATYATQVAARIVDVLDAQGNSVGAAAAGTTYVFTLHTGAPG